MTPPIYNDQAYIAEGFHLAEDFTSQTARLAYFKINSYKLSLLKHSFMNTRKELKANIECSLMNYTQPCIILADMGFFKSEYEN
jgi:hypothetical protein